MFGPVQGLNIRNLLDGMPDSECKAGACGTRTSWPLAGSLAIWKPAGGIWRWPGGPSWTVAGGVASPKGWPSQSGEAWGGPGVRGSQCGGMARCAVWEGVMRPSVGS